MRTTIARSRTLLAAVLGATWLLAPAAADDRERSGTWRSDRERGAGRSESDRSAARDTDDLQRATRLMEQHGISLPDAVRRAERFCEGRAVFAEYVIADTAEWPEPGRRPDRRGPAEERLTFKVVCVADNGQPVTIMVDGQTGEILRSRGMAARDLDVRPAGGDERYRVFRTLKATHVMGLAVHSPGHETLGDVADLALARDGQIAYAVLSSGGVLGVGDKYFAVPWQALDCNAADDYLVLDVTRDELRTAGGFDKERWPTLADTRWLRGERWNLAGAAERDMRRPEPRREQSIPRGDGIGGMDQARFDFKASRLIGKSVRDPQNEKLGTIHDLGVDPDNGRIVFVVLSHGGILGVGDKLIAIPWTAFDLSQAPDSVRLNASREKLEQAPNFERRDWTSVSDPAWLRDTFRYWGQEPYWGGGRAQMIGHPDERRMPGREPSRSEDWDRDSGR